MSLFTSPPQIAEEEREDLVLVQRHDNAADQGSYILSKALCSQVTTGGDCELGQDCVMPWKDPETSAEGQPDQRIGVENTELL